MPRRISLLLFVGLMTLPAAAQAWGGEGHRIVCGIAWQRLNPQARSLATRLLAASDEKTFVDACLWADDIKGDRADTYAYHFINIPAGKAGLVMRRDCGDPARRCAPWAIARYARILANPNSPEAQRAEALKFVLHFVGDLHQPLHAGRLVDRGGNEIPVTFFGHAGTPDRPMNLHSVWDSQILRRAGALWPGTARRLAEQVNAEDAKLWETLDVVAWANESYRVCEGFVYRLSANRRIGNAYYFPALGYTQLQLQKGGVRLAHLLNSAAAGARPPTI